MVLMMLIWTNLPGKRTETLIQRLMESCMERSQWSLANGERRCVHRACCLMRILMNEIPYATNLSLSKGDEDLSSENFLAT